MPKTLRNKWNECLSYEKLLEAHKLSKKSKGHRKEIICNKNVILKPLTINQNKYKIIKKLFYFI